MTKSRYDRKAYETDDEWTERVLGGPVESNLTGLQSTYSPPLRYAHGVPEARSGRRANCFEGHPRLSMGGGVFIGGRASAPAHDADVLVHLERADPPRFDSSRAMPKCVAFHIQNMGVPNFDATVALTRSLARLLAQGLTVHVGCIGGHGRTGLILGCLHHLVDPSTEDRVEWVRANYCRRAVEGKPQEDFVRNFASKVDKLILPA